MLWEAQFGFHGPLRGKEGRTTASRWPRASALASGDTTLAGEMVTDHQGWTRRPG